MHCFLLLLLLLLNLSCQSPRWRVTGPGDPWVELPPAVLLPPAPDGEPQDKKDQDDDALGTRLYPRSVMATDKEKQGAAMGQKDPTRRKAVAIYLMTGVRRIQSSVFDEQQTMQATGAEFSWIPKGWPIGLELGVQWSTNEEEIIVSNEPVTLDGFLGELYLGPRAQVRLLSIMDYPISAFLGGGITGMYADIEREQGGFSQSDGAFGWGFYAHTGLIVPGPENTAFGFDLRWVHDAGLTLFGDQSSADGFQVSILGAIEF